MDDPWPPEQPSVIDEARKLWAAKRSQRDVPTIMEPVLSIEWKLALMDEVVLKVIDMLVDDELIVKDGEVHRYTTHKVNGDVMSARKEYRNRAVITTEGILRLMENTLIARSISYLPSMMHSPVMSIPGFVAASSTRPHVEQPVPAAPVLAVPAPSGGRLLGGQQLGGQQLGGQLGGRLLGGQWQLPKSPDLLVVDSAQFRPLLGGRQIGGQQIGGKQLGGRLLGGRLLGGRLLGGQQLGGQQVEDLEDLEDLSAADLADLVDILAPDATD